MSEVSFFHFSFDSTTVRPLFPEWAPPYLWL